MAGILTLAGFAARPELSLTENNKLRLAEAAIVQLYVDSVNESKLVEEAINAMLASLDPHSQYSNAEETKELNEPLTGNFSGDSIICKNHNRIVTGKNLANITETFLYRMFIMF